MNEQSEDPLNDEASNLGQLAKLHEDHPALLGEVPPDVLSLLASKNAILVLPRASDCSAVLFDNSFFEHHVFVLNPDVSNHVISLAGSRCLVTLTELLLLSSKTSQLTALWSQDSVKKNSFPDTIKKVRNDGETIKLPIVGRVLMKIPKCEEQVEVIIINGIIDDSLFTSKTPRKPATINSKSKILDFSYSSKPARTPSNDPAFPSLFSNYIPSLFGSSHSITAKQSQTNIRQQAVVKPVDMYKSDSNYTLFITEVNKSWRLVMEINKYSTSFPGYESVDVMVDSLYSFFEKMRKLVGDDGIYAALEMHIFFIIHEKCFASINKLLREQDNQVHHRISLMSIFGFGFKHLGIDFKSDNDDFIKEAGFQLLKLDLEKSPMLKLACILKFHQVVIDALNSQGIKDNTSADVLVPTLIYTIVRTNPPNLASNLLYVSKFLYSLKNKQLMNTQGYGSYCLTNLLAVVSYIENFDLAILNVEDQHIPLITKTHTNNLDSLTKDIPISPRPMSSSTSINPLNNFGNVVADVFSGVGNGVKGLGSGFIGIFNSNEKIDMANRLPSKNKNNEEEGQEMQDKSPDAGDELSRRFSENFRKNLREKE